MRPLISHAQTVSESMIIYTYSQPHDFIQRGQVRRGNLVVCLHGNMAIDLGVDPLRTMMQVKPPTRWRWLGVMVGHQDRKGKTLA